MTDQPETVTVEKARLAALLEELQTHRQWRESVCDRLEIGPGSTPGYIGNLLRGITHPPWKRDLCEALELDPATAGGDEIVLKAREWMSDDLAKAYAALLASGVACEAWWQDFAAVAIAVGDEQVSDLCEAAGIDESSLPPVPNEAVAYHLIACLPEKRLRATTPREQAWAREFAWAVDLAWMREQGWHVEAASFTTFPRDGYPGFMTLSRCVGDASMTRDTPVHVVAWKRHEDAVLDLRWGADLTAVCEVARRALEGELSEEKSE